MTAYLIVYDAVTDMEEVRVIQRYRVNTAARHGKKLVHAVFYGSQGCNPLTSVPKRNDPHKTRENHRNGGWSKLASPVPIDVAA